MVSPKVEVFIRGAVIAGISIGYSILVIWRIIAHILQIVWNTLRTNYDEEPEVLTSGWKHGFIQLSEIRMHYVEIGSPDKPPMILIHGFPEFWYSYRYQLKHFQNDYHVIAVNLRGYAKSDKPPGVDSYDLSKSVDDIIEVIKAFSGPSGKAVVVGHDWGAAIAYFLAAKAPEVVHRLITLSIPHYDSFRKKRYNWNQFRKSWYMYFFQCPVLPEVLLSLDNFYFLMTILRGSWMGLKNSDNFGEDQANAWRYNFRNWSNLTPPINFYRAMMRKAIFEEPNDDISKMHIKPKTLIIFGDKDAFVEIDEDSTTDTLKHCDNGRVVHIPDGSHWIQQDNPELVNRYIEEFLAEEGD